jgi:uncharacterized repeat protein (TIGR04052 family)
MRSISKFGSRAQGRASTLGAAMLVAGSALGACGGDDDASVGPGLDAATGVVDGGVDASDGLMPVTLRFKAKLGSADLICGQSYPGQGSGKVIAKPQDFRFFVQDVRLIAADGREVPVLLDERAPYQTRDLALLDFTDGRDSCTTGDPGSNLVVTGRVPPGSYRGIAFANGVPEQLNHGNPATAPAPLQQPGISWSWLDGNRFFIAEMRHAPEVGLDGGVLPVATDGGISSGGGGHNATAATPGLAIAHIGSTTCLGGLATGIRCERPNRNAVKLMGFDPTINTVVADLAAVFSQVDLERGLLCHARGDLCIPPLTAVGLDLVTGQPVPTQSVFRVE